jgi:hypothetical protein
MHKKTTYVVYDQQKNDFSRSIIIDEYFYKYQPNMIHKNIINQILRTIVKS